MTRLSEPIWFAASPTPPESTSVSMRSSARRKTALSIAATLLALCLRMLCGYFSIGTTATMGSSGQNIAIRRLHTRAEGTANDYSYGGEGV